MKTNNIKTTGFKSLVSQTWKSCLVLAMILMITTVVRAQGEFETDPDATIPVDGGLSLLVAAGVGYGAKKIHDARKRKADKEIL